MVERTTAAHICASQPEGAGQHVQWAAHGLLTGDTGLLSLSTSSGAALDVLMACTHALQFTLAAKRIMRDLENAKLGGLSYASSALGGHPVQRTRVSGPLLTPCKFANLHHLLLQLRMPKEVHINAPFVLHIAEC